MRRKVLHICGVLNQTQQLHKIAQQLPDCDHYFTSFYVDGVLKFLRDRKLLEFTGVGYRLGRRTLAYFSSQNLNVDEGGNGHNYDLVLTCSDLIVQKNIRGRKLILVQEGMTDPENWAYHLVKGLHLPRYIASTSTTGLSHAYDYFCVASEGYRELFIKKGVDPRKIRVTGIPNFDNCRTALDNDFPYRNYVLVATSDMRETFKHENRPRFIQKCLQIADGRDLIFKLHPNENVERATAEIRALAPHALVYSSGNTDHMIANCDVLITRYSTVVYVGIALGKEVYTDFDLDEIRRLTPIQNNGASAAIIASICRLHIEGRPVPDDYERLKEMAGLAASPVDETGLVSANA